MCFRAFPSQIFDHKYAPGVDCEDSAGPATQCAFFWRLRLK